MTKFNFKWIALAGCAALIVSCAKSRLPDAAGTNTNWLQSCERDAQCGDLSCHCGVCTRPCDDADACEGLGARAMCAPIDESTCSQVESFCVAEPERDAGGTGGTGGDASGNGGAGGDVASGSGGEGGAGGAVVTRTTGGEIEIPDAFRTCEQNSDCATVGASCSCCTIAAVTAELMDSYYAQMDLACADCRTCPLCDCGEQDLVARCEDSLCVAVPRDAERDCVSPTQNTDLAYADDAVGCFCDIHEQSACVGPAALVCAPTEAALTWQAVEDGPCAPRETACPTDSFRSTVTECLSEFATCIEQPDGTFCGERCYETEPCPNDTGCMFAEIDHETPCSDLGAPVWEGFCYQGTIRYRSSNGGLGGGTSYWNAETGELVASAGYSDTNQYCDGTSFDVTRGDLYVIAMCEVIEDETTKACVE